MEPRVNPFQYGGVVGPEAFCNRQQELRDLRRAVINGERLFVYSERRMGKTSLVQQVLAGLPASEFLTVYVDLWATDSPEAFVRTTAKAITQAATTRRDRLLQTAKSLFHLVVPTVTFDESGEPSIEFSIRHTQAPETELDDVLSALARAAQRQKKKVVIVFDEFQRIMEYGNDLVERVVRSRMQMQQDVACFFLGSRKHLMQQLFLEASRPLYRSAGHYPLGTIALEHWQPFIRERFTLADKSIADERIVQLCTWTEGHPFYTQHLAHALWEITPAGGEVTEQRLDEALALLLRREGNVFATRWETFSRMQQRLLRGLVQQGGNPQPFATTFIRAHGLGAASTVQRAVNALLASDVLDREEGRLFVSDRFFALWIRQLNAG
jgi:hypothetical protein